MLGELLQALQEALAMRDREMVQAAVADLEAVIAKN